MPAHSIADKFRRALRNGTGATFTLDQLREMAGYGLLVELARIEANELWPVNKPDAADAELKLKRPSTGKRPDRGPLSIAVLSEGL